MRKIRMYNIGANLLFIFHFLVVVIISFGWLISSIWYVYMATLIITFFSEVILGYCFLSKWEFSLRKKINPEVNYDYSFTSFYTYKLTQHRLSTTFIARAGFM